MTIHDKNIGWSPAEKGIEDDQVQSGGAEFVGEWVNIKAAKRFAKIYAEGKAFVWQDNEGKYRGIMKEKELRVSGPFGEISVAYVDSTDHIIMAGEEYRRKK